MKSFIVLLLCVCFCLSACYTSTALPTDLLPTQSPVTTTSENTEAVYETYNEPLIAISTPLITENTLSDDGNVIFTYSTQDITLTMDDPVVAETIMDDFISRNDFSASSLSLAESAKAAYTRQSDWKPYSYSIVYNPVRFDYGVLSFYGNEMVDNGSPRSTSTSISVTYDMLSGNVLSLNDILVAGYSAEQLVSKILDSLEPMSQQGILFTDYEYIISDQFSTNVPTDKWYFSNAGLCFYFSPYEIAPYNAGTVVAAIPYGELIGLLKDTYFPAEQVKYQGKLSVLDAASADLNAYERITEIIINPDGKEYLLIPEGTALNVQLQFGALNNGGFAYTVYAANALTQGDAVLLQLDDSYKENLSISYNENINQKLFP